MEMKVDAGGDVRALVRVRVVILAQLLRPREAKTCSNRKGVLDRILVRVLTKPDNHRIRFRVLSKPDHPVFLTRVVSKPGQHWMSEGRESRVP